ncbi:MAG: hypothetical protein Q8S43_04070 [Actinomycetota bacterium]|nr:hypothetical protein [Actinomycetota bacterium]
MNEQRPRTPQTQLGWWAVGLMTVAGMSMLLNGPLFMSGLVRLQGIGIPIYLGILGGSALGAALCSILAMTLKHDRSWLLYVPLAPAILIMLFLIGEFGSSLIGLGH